MADDDIYERLVALRKSMFDEGFLDGWFDQAEQLGDESGDPNFIINLINIFFTDITSRINQLEEKMRYNLDHGTIDRLLSQIKGASASIGAKRIAGEADQMIHHFNANNYRRSMESFGLLRREHDALRSRLFPYAQLLDRLNQGQGQGQGQGRGPSEAGSGNEEDLTSTALHL